MCYQPCRKNKTKEESDDDMKEEFPDVKKDEPDSNDEDEDDGLTEPSCNTEEGDIRDMKYKLEKLISVS